jgi:cellulose synthase/poly-beta-1,6-N-acetylglucosamine synthase-like glycosyltransferase
VIVACRMLAAVLLVLIAYPYVVYPAALWALRRMRPRPWSKAPYRPKVSILVAAHNESAVLAPKLRNTLELNYPADRREVIVASDASTDGTDDIVRSFSPDVRLVRLDRRSGKQTALNAAAASAAGEVFVFTDASVRLAPDALEALTQNFADPSIGAVSSVIRVTSPGEDGLAAPAADGADDAEGAYLGLDLMTRRLESEVFSAVGCAGSCYAVRRACFIPFDEGACNDFVSALDAVRLGYRAVVEPRAVGYMLPARTLQGEFRRKARTIAGGLDTLLEPRTRTLAARHPIFCWSLVSHKIARWIGPLLLILLALVLAVGAACGDWIASTLLAAGAALGACAAAGLAFPRLRSTLPPVRYALFAAVAWSAALVGWFWYLTGRRQVVWQPTLR